MSHYKQTNVRGHWTLKNRSCWPWLYDPQVNVTRLSHVSLTIFISCFHNRKVETHFLKVSLILTSSPTLGHGPWGQESWNESRPSRVPMVQIWMFSDEWLARYTPLEKLKRKPAKKSTNAMEGSRTNEHMNGRTERQKLYTPRYKCRGTIISSYRYFVFSRGIISSFRYFVFLRGVISSFRYFVFSRGVISSFRYFVFSLFRLFAFLYSCAVRIVTLCLIWLKL